MHNNIYFNEIIEFQTGVLKNVCYEKYLKTESDWYDKFWLTFVSEK